MRHLRYRKDDANLTYSKTPLMRSQLDHKILVVNTRWSCKGVRLSSLRKQPTCRDVTNGFPAKWSLRNERRNSILTTCYHLDLASDWLCRKGNYFNQSEALPRSRQWHVISMEFCAVLPQASFCGETSGSVAICRLFSHLERVSSYLRVIVRRGYTVAKGVNKSWQQWVKYDRQGENDPK